MVIERAMHIRPFQPSDAEHLGRIFHASVHEIGIRDYTTDQTAIWSVSPPDPEIYLRRGLGARIFLVAVDGNGEPIGYGDVEPSGHIDHLYCRPDVVGTGVGSALYDALEEAALSAGIAALFVDTSETARRLFERKGFSAQYRNDLVIGGVAIHNYFMTKILGSAADTF